MKYNKTHKSLNQESAAADIALNNSVNYNGSKFLKFFLIASFPFSFIQLTFAGINATTFLIFLMGSVLHGVILYSITGSRLRLS